MGSPAQANPGLARACLERADYAQFGVAADGMPRHCHLGHARAALCDQPLPDPAGPGAATNGPIAGLRRSP
jgi:hypothetical protein